VAEVDVAGRLLVVYNAHLESRGSEQLRKAQVEQILADSRRYPANAAMLIAGDFNTRGTSIPAIAALLQAGFRMAVGQQVTTTRGSALDWIFVRGPLTFEKGAIHSDTKASDHFPLTVVIHLAPAALAALGPSAHRTQPAATGVPPARNASLSNIARGLYDWN
jgi:endonuclease/exonuclease/phosphatase family metal-dependent hydrolase